MPYSLLVECSYPGCRDLVGRGRCPAHSKINEYTPRDTTARRGYDHRWRLLSERYRRTHPFCEIRSHCKGSWAVDVDHIVSLADAPSRRYDQSNLQSACRRCHNAKTRAAS